jgi:hypothetical protein
MSAGNNGKSWGQPREAKRYSNLRDLSVIYEGDSQDVVTRPPDLSARGMFINTNRSFPEGAVLNVQFRLAQSDVEVRTRCEVRYCLPGVGVGVEFVEISPESVRAIEREIEASNLEPSPQPVAGGGKRKPQSE